MTSYIGHLFLGLIFFFVIVFLLNYIMGISLDIYSPVFYYLLLLTLFSSLLADIDHENSKIFRFMLTITAIFMFIVAFYVMNYRLGYDLILSLFVSFIVITITCFLFRALKPDHRTWTHSIFFMGIYTIGIWFLLGGLFAIFALSGYMSHTLVGDRHFSLF